MPASQEAPPTYAQATGSSTASNKQSTGGAANATQTTTSSSSKLQVPGSHNGIPASARRSMEDERRPLPEGWIRQWDSKEKHQFFVDTRANPPRSIWHHPHDDDQYLKSLSSEERERIQEQERDLKHAHHDVTDDEAQPQIPAELPPRPNKQQQQQAGQKEKSSFGRKLKDKMTGMTHEEREADRARREEEERQYYEAHLRFREAMQRAQATGQPQFFAKDRDGKEIFIEPPYGPGSQYAPYGQGGYGYNPYASGPYANPNARFIRPGNPYGRPYGPGYGGGMGLPIAGGVLGGLLLGGLLF